MSSFKQESNRLTRTFSKRTLYDVEQFYDLKVTTINHRISVNISSSQLTTARIEGDKELIQKIIADLQEIIEL